MKLIKVLSAHYIHQYGQAHGPLLTPFMEKKENIKRLIVDGMEVVEVLKDKEVVLTLGNYDKDNGTSIPTPPPVQIEISLNKTTVALEVGGTDSITATPEGCRYVSANKAVATCDETNGAITAVSAGTAKINVTKDGCKPAQCTVTVTEVPTPPEEGEQPISRGRQK